MNIRHILVVTALCMLAGIPTASADSYCVLVDLTTTPPTITIYPQNCGPPVCVPGVWDGCIPGIHDFNAISWSSDSTTPPCVSVDNTGHATVATWRCLQDNSYSGNYPNQWTVDTAQTFVRSLN